MEKNVDSTTPVRQSKQSHEFGDGSENHKKRRHVDIEEEPIVVTDNTETDNRKPTTGQNTPSKKKTPIRRQTTERPSKLLAIERLAKKYRESPEPSPTRRKYRRKSHTSVQKKGAKRQRIDDTKELNMMDETMIVNLSEDMPAESRLTAEASESNYPTDQHEIEANFEEADSNFDDNVSSTTTTCVDEEVLSSSSMFTIQASNRQDLIKPDDGESANFQDQEEIHSKSGSGSEGSTATSEEEIHSKNGSGSEGSTATSDGENPTTPKILRIQQDKPPKTMTRHFNTFNRIPTDSSSELLDDYHEHLINEPSFSRDNTEKTPITPKSESDQENGGSTLHLSDPTNETKNASETEEDDYAMSIICGIWNNPTPPKPKPKPSYKEKLRRLQELFLYKSEYEYTFVASEHYTSKMSL